MWFPVCLFPLIDLCIPDIIPAAPGCPVGRVYCASWCNFFLCIPVVRLFSSWCLCLAVQKAIDDRDSTVNIAETRCTEWVVYMPQIINKTETSRKTNHRQCVNVYAREYVCECSTLWYLRSASVSYFLISFSINTKKNPSGWCEMRWT